MRILVLPCDGIGPEIIQASMSVLDVANEKFGLGLTFDYDDVGFTSLEKHGITLRDETLEKAKTYDGVILGTHPTPTTRRPKKAVATSLPAFASALISMPTCARRAPGRSSPPT